MSMQTEWMINEADNHPFDRPSVAVASSSFLPKRCPSPPIPSSTLTFVEGSGGSVRLSAGAAGGRLSYIEHPVSKLDTLAGVAIKYGVEVADIKRINGLVTDLQMFALKTLRIPLPGRHPPSTILSNGLDTQRPSSSKQSPTRRRHSDYFDSFQSLKMKSTPHQKLSPAMSSLQGYYGLKSTDPRLESEGLEMAVYWKGGSHFLEDVAQTSTLNPPLSHHRKSRSAANGFMSENGVLADDVSVAEGDLDRSCSEKLLRRRQKSEVDFGSRTPETLLKEDSSSNSCGFSASAAGKSLALRPKAVSRIVSGTETEAGRQSGPTPQGLGDSLSAESINGVRKSSSTSNLEDSDNSISSSVWPTSKWSLKPDLQALSASSITKPIFDGLPKPISGWKTKAALD